MTQTKQEVATSSAARSIIATATGFLVRWLVTKSPQLAVAAPEMQEFIADVIGVAFGAAVKWLTARWTARSVSVVEKK